MPESALNDRDARLRGMMRRLDIDLLEFAYARVGAVYDEARRSCRACPSTVRCRTWLASASDEPPLFCINLSRFERFSRH